MVEKYAIWADFKVQSKNAPRAEETPIIQLEEWTYRKPLDEEGKV